jgi:hypothetical protein
VSGPFLSAGGWTRTRTPPKGTPDFKSPRLVSAYLGDLDFPWLSDLFVLLAGDRLSAGLAATPAATTGTAVLYLRPSTRFTLLPRASLLPGLGL